jgi:two-component system sensor histidine kinase BaeS
MTADRWFRSPLGRRLFAAFLFVALSSVAVLTAAALVGTARGLTNAQQSDREQAAARTAEAAAVAYQHADGWNGADLDAASATAGAAGARLIVLDRSARMVWPGRGMGPGMATMHSDSTTGAVVPASVVVGGQNVGSVRLVFTTAVTGGSAVAWSWVFGAAAVALLTALAAAAYVTRRLARPLQALTVAARRFAAGQSGARAGIEGPGELGELARAFDTMADDLVRADQARRSLAADVAHELRTPLAALQAGLEELRDGLRDPDTERLAALHDQTLRLGRVVQDLADLSAAESAALSLHRTDTDLGDIARTALAAYRTPLDAAGLHVRTDLPVTLPVRADPDRLHQAVTNLLANAARYCRPGDHLTIRGHPEHDNAVLEIADTGPGIPADDLPHVFQRLWRGRHARSIVGSGIGLAVVRELVIAHGGTVSAASPPTGGTAITIRLPLAEPGHAPDDYRTLDSRPTER